MKFSISLAAVSSVALISLSAQAQTSVTTFGALPGATYAGTGINIGSNQVTTVSGLFNGDAITLGLAATPYKVGSVGNNGNGTYFATPGVSPANASRATWNFDFYVGINNAPDLGDYSFNLAYTDGTTSGSFDPGELSYFDAIFNNAPSYSIYGFQDSENIDFYGFNPATPGVYTFDLSVSDDSGFVADDSITVDVGTVPDAASTLSMLSIAGAGLALARRKMAR